MANFGHLIQVAIFKNLENLLFFKQFLEHPAKTSGTINQRKNPCDDFNEVELTTHFRLAKTTAQKLLKTETAVTD